MALLEGYPTVKLSFLEILVFDRQVQVKPLLCANLVLPDERNRPLS